MLSRLYRGSGRLISTGYSLQTTIRSIPMRLSGKVLNGESLCVPLARAVATTSSRNVDAFSPVLNTFAAQYVMVEDKAPVIRELAKESNKNGFPVLSDALTGYLENPDITASINLYSILIISAIQVKDDTLLNFFLDDMDKYAEVNSKNVYEVLRRVCHYRRYPAFVRFLNSFIDVSSW